MPQLFRVGHYIVYFWINESNPLEPVHVYIAEVRPAPNGTKIWITRRGNCLKANNNSHISERDLRILMEIVEARSGEIAAKWLETFGQIEYYC